jgi:hypothetical protein
MRISVVDSEEGEGGGAGEVARGGGGGGAAAGEGLWEGEELLLTEGDVGEEGAWVPGGGAGGGGQQGWLGNAFEEGAREGMCWPGMVSGPLVEAGTDP